MKSFTAKTPSRACRALYQVDRPTACCPAVFHSTITPRLSPEIYGASPLLLVPLTVCIAMYAGPVGGAAAGIAGGFLWDLYSDRLLGFNALLLLAVGCACGLLVLPAAAE